MLDLYFLHVLAVLLFEFLKLLQLLQPHNLLLLLIDIFICRKLFNGGSQKVS